MRARFPMQARITRAKDFEAVYRAGEQIRVFPLRARALRRPQASAAAGSRLGMAIGSRVGRAVLRNRWKRAIREAFRLHRHRLPSAYDIVIGVESDTSPADTSRVEQAFLAIVDALRENTQSSPPPRPTD